MPFKRPVKATLAYLVSVHLTLLGLIASSVLNEAGASTAAPYVYLVEGSDIAVQPLVRETIPVAIGELSFGITYSGTVLVGCPGDNAFNGSLALFNRNEDGSWSQTNDNFLANVNFTSTEVGLGYSAAISYDGSTAIASAAYDLANRGTVWVYRQQSPSGTWVAFQQVPTPPNISRFGHYLALSGNASFAAVSGIHSNGSAMMYTYYRDQTTKMLVSKDIFVSSGTSGSDLYPAFSKDEGYFCFVDSSSTSHPVQCLNITNEWSPIAIPAVTGQIPHSIAMSYDGTTIAIGASTSSPSESGVFILRRHGTQYVQDGNILLGSTSPNTHFSSLDTAQVALSNDGNYMAYISGGAGLAWAFQRLNGQWTQMGNEFTSSTRYFVTLAFSGDASTLLFRLVDTSQSQTSWDFFRVMTKALVTPAPSMSPTPRPTFPPNSGELAFTLALSVGVGLGGLIGLTLLSAAALVYWRRRRYLKAASETPETVVFLTHDWGKVAKNHSRVMAINQALKSLGLVTWFDSDRLDGDVMNLILAGIEKTRFVLVFVTEGYMHQVETKTSQKIDYCQTEFFYALNRKGKDRMIICVLDKELEDQKKWFGPLGGVFNQTLFVKCALDDDPHFTKAAENIKQELDKRMQNLGEGDSISLSNILRARNTQASRLAKMNGSQKKIRDTQQDASNHGPMATGRGNATSSALGPVQNTSDITPAPPEVGTVSNGTTGINQSGAITISVDEFEAMKRRLAALEQQQRPKPDTDV